MFKQSYIIVHNDVVGYIVSISEDTYSINWEFGSEGTVPLNNSKSYINPNGYLYTNIFRDKK